MSWSKNPLILISLGTAMINAAPAFAVPENQIDTPESIAPKVGKMAETTTVVATSEKPSQLELPDAGDNGSPELKITIGAPRGNDSNLELSIYIPADHIIRSADYVLKWELSEATQTPVKLVLTDDSIDPVVEKIIAQSSEAGIHQIELQSLAVQFEVGIDYEWIMQACSTKSCDTPARDLMTRTYFRIDK